MTVGLADLIPELMVGNSTNVGGITDADRQWDTESHQGSHRRSDLN